MSIQGALTDLMKVFFAFYIGCAVIGRADIPIQLISQLRASALVDNKCIIMHYQLMRLKRTSEYIEWYESQRPKERAQIAKRLANIEEHEHFGSVRDLGDFLSELKWVNGRRVYYSVMEDEKGILTLLILGGNKNGQDSDIKKARKILKKYIEG